WTRDLPREHGFEPLVVEGALPTTLRGTLYRNGPGQFGQFGKRYAHPFEGDGALTAIRFEAGRVIGASKLTQSAGLVAERAADKVLYGSVAPWHRRIANGLSGKQKNTANTNVIVWQGRVLALMEAARPTELDPGDLRTIGETDLGAITSMFSAHPHRVVSRKAVYNFGLQYGRKTMLHVYELPDVGAARQLGAVELPAATMLHDFIATDTHLVFFISPVRVSIPRMLLQIGGFEDFFRWRPEHGTEILCVPIDRPTEPVRIHADAFYQWHFANARSDGNRIVVDYIRYPTFDTFYKIGGMVTGNGEGAISEGRYHRATIDLATHTFSDERILDRSCEFPTIAPGASGRAHAFTYLALDELGGIGKLDVTTGKLDAHVLPQTQRATEPVFVANGPGEDDGHVLTLCADGPSDRAFVAVYDAKRIAAGPVAKVWLDHSVPITFHGTFAPS
ncbi:MAG TPA: carotenoid oxygenase family protein, partial [Kofleriaceae bacterium]|nr:carotenoid oxygenase family protein [Kofleriaceae bacterium]